MQFLAAKVRQADGPVTLTSFGDGEALLFDEEFDGENYTTWIYCYDGWLREYFGPEGEEPMPELGEPVLEAGSLSMALEDEFGIEEMGEEDMANIKTVGDLLEYLGKHLDG